MTNKRFNFVGGYLYDGNKPIGHVEDIKFRQDYEDIVNALHEENEQLKGEVAHYKLILMSLEQEAKRISKIR